MPPETVQTLLAEAQRLLREQGCDTPALDARLLFQHVAGMTREALILGAHLPVSAEVAGLFQALIARRARREPVSRILGLREFYGRTFTVTPAVLDPRPDTETLVDAALKLMPAQARVLDLGTGSGAIAVTLLAERPDAGGLAVDISPEALAVARANADALGVGARLQLVEGSWFAPVRGRFDLIVSNPPYIPARDIEALSPDVRNFDPALALVGGEDGLDPYRVIAAEAAGYLADGGNVAVEIGAGQAAEVERIFERQGFVCAGRHHDLGGHVRCLVFHQLETQLGDRIKKLFGNPTPLV
jgi:release factor glutamine methyltransferase